MKFHHSDYKKKLWSKGAHREFLDYITGCHFSLYIYL